MDLTELMIGRSIRRPEQLQRRRLSNAMKMGENGKAEISVQELQKSRSSRKANWIAMSELVVSADSVLGASKEVRGELRENLRKLRLMIFKSRYWDYGPFVD